MIIDNGTAWSKNWKKSIDGLDKGVIWRERKNMGFRAD